MEEAFQLYSGKGKKGGLYQELVELIRKDHELAVSPAVHYA